MEHATAGVFLGISGVVWFWIISIVGIGGVVYSLNRRFGLLRLGREDNRFDRLGERFKHMMVYALGQKKMFDDRFAGLYHLFIFYGFLVVSIRTVRSVTRGGVDLNPMQEMFRRFFPEGEDGQENRFENPGSGSGFGSASAGCSAAAASASAIFSSSSPHNSSNMRSDIGP